MIENISGYMEMGESPLEAALNGSKQIAFTIVSLTLIAVHFPLLFMGDVIGWVLRHQVFTLLIAVGTLILTIWLYVVIPKGFFPVQDTGLIQGVTLEIRPLPSSRPPARFGS